MFLHDPCSPCGVGESASTPVLTVANGHDADGPVLRQWLQSWAAGVKWHQIICIAVAYPAA